LTTVLSGQKVLGHDGRKEMVSMESIEEAPRDRRSFLAQLGKTLTAALGVGLVASASARATTTVCAIFCQPANGCAGCSGSNYFHCDTMCGYSFDACFDHSCSAFCYSPNAC
jgi:hypothetical protein